MVQQMTAQRYFLSRALLATMLGLVGYVINCLPLPLFSNVQLVLGNALILVCASRLGLGYTLWCAAIALTGLMQTFGTAYVYLVYGLEALFVCALRRRGWFLIYADFIYWCVLGMPLTWLVIQHAFYIPGDYQLFTVVKQGFNGLFYAALASLCLLLIPKSWFAHIQQQPYLRHNIHKKLVHAVLVLISLALMISVLFASNHLMQVQQVQLTERIHERSDHLISQYDGYLQAHHNALLIISHTLSNLEPVLWPQHIDDLQQFYPNFLHLTISETTNDGSSPAQLSERAQSQTESNQAERAPYIASQVDNIDGQPAAAIRVWVHSADGKLIGQLSGWLALSQHAVNKKRHDLWHGERWVLTDRKGDVIDASQTLPLLAFSAFDYTVGSNSDDYMVPLMNISQADPFVNEYFYTASTLGNGWQLYVLLPYRLVAEQQEKQFLIGMALLLLGMGAVIFFTRKISAYITAPLEFLVQSLAKGQRIRDPLHPLPALPKESTTEICALYQELSNNRNALKVYQLQLEDLVQTRTAELEAANARLAQLAHRDGLTGAYNRRYFDQQFEVNRQHCARSGGYLALAMIDIDHFKAVNDNHGHLVGDDCLKSLVTLIQQQFSRKLDLLARFGGEEFVLLLPQSDAGEVLKRLEALRRKVAQTAMSEDDQGNSLFVTISIGVLIAKPKYSETMNYWLMAADDALYHAKEQGRNRLSQAQVTFSEAPVSEEPSWTVQEVEQPIAQ